MSSDERDQVLSWMLESTDVFLGAVDRLADDAFGQPSALPGWTVGAVVAHVHYNAEAIRRLLRWALTGVETPMYASREARNREIEDGALLGASDLRSLVSESAGQLSAEVAGLGSEEWNAPVVTAMGRTVPASETLWMRTREVAVHAVDLRAGVTFADLPRDVTLRLSTEIVTKRHAGTEGAAITAWLTGRSGPPELEPWL